MYKINQLGLLRANVYLPGNYQQKWTPQPHPQKQGQWPVGRREHTAAPNRMMQCPSWRNVRTVDRTRHSCPVTWRINWTLHAHELKTSQTVWKKRMNWTHEHNPYDKTSNNSTPKTHDNEGGQQHFHKPIRRILYKDKEMLLAVGLGLRTWLSRGMVPSPSHSTHKRDYKGFPYIPTK